MDLLTQVLRILLPPRILQGSNRFAILLIALGLSSSVILSATSGTIKGVKNVWQQHTQKVQLKEALIKQRENYSKANKELKQKLDDKKITPEEFTAQATFNNEQIKSLDNEINK